MEKEPKTKTEFQKGLADSFALCDKAFDALTDQNATEFVNQGRGQVARAGLLAGMIAHSNEMYGTAGVYLRGGGNAPAGR